MIGTLVGFKPDGGYLSYGRRPAGTTPSTVAIVIARSMKRSVHVITSDGVVVETSTKALVTLSQALGQQKRAGACELPAPAQ